MNRMRLAAVALLSAGSLGLSMGVSRAYADEPVCHVEVLKSYPNGTWLENLAQDRRGRLFYSVMSDKKIELYEPGKGSRHFADLPIYPMGIAIVGDRLVVSGNRRPMSDGAATLQTNAVVEVSLSGKVGRLTDLPEAKMLNGVVVAPGGAVLIADSRAGKIWRYAPRSGEVSVWLADDLLAPPPSAPPAAVGANGLKIRHGALLVSNSGRGEILSVPISTSGTPSGAVSTSLKPGVVDDFDVDQDGSIIAAPYSTKIIGVSKAGDVSVILPEGAEGATAVSIIRGGHTKRSFYVLTTGNLLFGGKGPAQLLKVEAPRGAGCKSTDGA